MTLFCVFAQVEAVQVEVDEVLALLAVVVETDQLDGEYLRQLGDLEPFYRVAVLPSKFSSSVSSFICASPLVPGD